MINQLYISTKDHNWDNVKLIPLNQKNVINIINKEHSLDCRTSPEDLSFEFIHAACGAATNIHLIDLDFNKIGSGDFKVYGRLLNELVTRQQHKIIGEFNVWQHRIPKTNRPPNPVLWAFGCSTTYGHGVDASQRYSKLVADSLNLPEMSLAYGGSSVFWSADQILRSDIRPGDVVLWGVTIIPRVEIADDWKFKPVNLPTYHNLERDKQHWNINWFSSPTQTLMAMHYIDQVQNFCKKIGVDLYLLNLGDISWMSVSCLQYPNYLDTSVNLEIKDSAVVFLDCGTDNMHPGPKQHQKWANEILEFIKDKNKS